jgi:hypothetical protein
MFQLQLIFKANLSLVQSTEFVDLVLVLSPDLNLVAAGCSFIFFGQLNARLVSAVDLDKLVDQRHTIRRCILCGCGVDNRVMPWSFLSIPKPRDYRSKQSKPGT